MCKMNKAKMLFEKLASNILKGTRVISKNVVRPAISQIPKADFTVFKIRKNLSKLPSRSPGKLLSRRWIHSNLLNNIGNNNGIY